MSERVERLTGRVATILNARELAIDIGEEKGVDLKMRFAVLSGEPIEIRDPTTNEVLDTVDREKVRVEVTEVRKLVSICQTYRTKLIPGSALSELVAQASIFQPARKVRETLSIKDADLPPPLSEEESFVKVGDRVVELKAE